MLTYAGIRDAALGDDSQHHVRRKWLAASGQFTFYAVLSNMQAGTEWYIYVGDVQVNMLTR